jgi:hypothetical protein
MLLSLLLGFAFAALLSLSRHRYMGETAVTMAAAPSAMTQFESPMAWRSLQPSKVSQALRAHEIDRSTEPQMEPKRRDLLAASAFAMAGASMKDRAAHAAYGDGANIFGQITNPSGFGAYAGDGFSLLIPSKWNPSKERDFPGTVLRYEDNQDIVNQLTVIKEKTSKNTVADYGTPEQWLNSYSFLLGQQSYNGKSISEGGFAPDRVSAASVLDLGSDTDKKGRTVYKYNILSRTADGNEGGRHQLISATVSSGTLYILKLQVGDKRWFKGAKKEAEGTFNSFNIA